MRTLIVIFACQLAFSALNAEILTGPEDSDACLPYVLDSESTNSESTNSESTNYEPTNYEPTNSESTNNEPIKNSDANTAIDQGEFVKYQGAFLRKDLVQLLFEELEPQALSTKCFSDLNEYRSSLQNGTSWAFKRE